MTFFYDDMQTPKAPPSRRRKWLRRAIWLVIGMVVLLWVSLRALMTLGGHDPQLQRGIETSLGRSTGLAAHIGVLHAATFYPLIGLDAGDISLSEPGGDTPVATIGAMTMQSDFWDRVRGRAALQTFLLKDIDVPPRFFAQPMHIDSVVLAKGQDSGKVSNRSGDAALDLTGSFGAQGMTGRVAMMAQTRRDGRVYYTRPTVSPFALHAGIVDLAGSLHDRPDGLGIVIDRATIDGIALIADLTLSQGSHGHALVGMVRIGQSPAKLDLHWGDRTGGLHGSLTMLALAPQDDAALARLLSLPDVLGDGGRQALATALNFDITVTVGGAFDAARLDRWQAGLGDALLAGAAGGETGHVTADLHAARGLLNVATIHGSQGGASVDGQGHVDLKPGALDLVLARKVPGKTSEALHLTGPWRTATVTHAP